MIVIVDYGVGNLGSIINMLRRLGVPAQLSRNADDIACASRLILPGVGAFDNAMRKLRDTGYVEVLEQRVVVERIPVLGICIGMQMLGRRSEEGVEPGLAWIDAESVKFAGKAAVSELKVPHMGWNAVEPHGASSLFPTGQGERRFYFVHSYHVICAREEDVLASTHYGIDFVSAVCRENILGTQFHPEKSHRFGLDFLRAFATWEPIIGSASSVGTS